MPSADHVLMLAREELAMVPEVEAALIGLDGQIYRVHWVCGYSPKRHAFLVRCAEFRLVSGRRVDARTYAFIQFTNTPAGRTEWREIEL